MADKDFGIYQQLQEAVRNDAVAVPASSTLLTYARNRDNKRKMIMIRNISTNVLDVITINLGLQSATANTGIRLNKDESFVDSTSEGYECFQGEITAICATANGNVMILER